MTREVEKAAYEQSVFLVFLNRANLAIDRRTITHGCAAQKEPDFLCEFIGGEKVGFELGRLVDPNLAKVVNRWEPRNGEFVRTSDPSGAIARRKMKLTYSITSPIELLLYKEQPIITPDNVILPTIRPVCHMKHNYRRIWFMGDSIELLYERR